jgi:hypothetical protein
MSISDFLREGLNQVNNNNNNKSIHYDSEGFDVISDTDEIDRKEIEIRNEIKKIQQGHMKGSILQKASNETSKHVEQSTSKTTKPLGAAKSSTTTTVKSLNSDNNKTTNSVQSNSTNGENVTSNSNSTTNNNTTAATINKVTVNDVGAKVKRRAKIEQDPNVVYKINSRMTLMNPKFGCFFEQDNLNMDNTMLYYYEPRDEDYIILFTQTKNGRESVVKTSVMAEPAILEYRDHYVSLKKNGSLSNIEDKVLHLLEKYSKNIKIYDDTGKRHKEIFPDKERSSNKKKTKPKVSNDLKTLRKEIIDYEIERCEKSSLMSQKFATLKKKAFATLKSNPEKFDKDDEWVIRDFMQRTVPF